MTKEEAKKIIKESIEKYGVVTTSDDFVKEFNAGVEFMAARFGMYADEFMKIAKEPPHLE